jgi:rSAM/selenodomain-associated transferase 2
MTTISIIIPTYNEAGGIVRLINYLNQNSTSAVVDLIVSDGGSEDGTLEMAKQAGANAVLSPGKGRSAQMNYGASLAKGDVLYFVHADSFPPPGFVKDIQQAIHQGFDLGRYRTRFDSPKLILKLNEWFTRFDFFICMGGDQTLFIRRQLFETFNGFREDMRIMEEYEFCARVRKTARYRIIPGSALISARKYDSNSWLRVQRANATVVSMYKRGATQQQMVDTYKQMLSYRKNAF